MPTDRELSALLLSVLNQNSLDTDEFRRLFYLCAKDSIKKRCLMQLLDLTDKLPEIYLCLDDRRVWLFAYFNLWDWVKFNIEKNHKIDADTAPAQGLHQGKSLFWLACFAKRWDVAKLLMTSNPNVNTAPVQGYHRGKTAFWLATISQEWGLVFNMLKTKPDLNATPQEGVAHGLSAFKYVATLKKIGLVKIIWQIMQSQYIAPLKSDTGSKDCSSISDDNPIVPLVGSPDIKLITSARPQSIFITKPDIQTPYLSEFTAEDATGLLRRLRSPLAATEAKKRKEMASDSDTQPTGRRLRGNSLDKAVTFDGHKQSSVRPR